MINKIEKIIRQGFKNASFKEMPFSLGTANTAPSSDKYEFSFDYAGEEINNYYEDGVKSSSKMNFICDIKAKIGSSDKASDVRNSLRNAMEKAFEEMDNIDEGKIQLEQIYYSQFGTTHVGFGFILSCSDY